MLSRRWWHQNTPRFALLDCADPAVVDARYQRRGQPGAWYASSKERSAHYGVVEVLAPSAVQPYVVGGPVGAELLVADEFADKLGQRAVVGVATSFGAQQRDGGVRGVAPAGPHVRL